MGFLWMLTFERIIEPTPVIFFRKFSFMTRSLSNSEAS